MKRLFFILAVLIFSAARAEEAQFADLVLTKAPINRWDTNSIKRGAKFFANTCMSCHTLIYLRYDKLAEEAGITLAKMPINVKQWPFGVKPPDLSLEANVRGVDWIYTYLHSFYQDQNRPTGANNLLVPNTAMPNILAPFQGDQVLLPTRPAPGILYNDTPWYAYLNLIKQGTMAPEEFDSTVADLVNFLAYAAEPFYQQQQHIGWWVLGFLTILFVLMALLKKEYWRDIKDYHD